MREARSVVPFADAFELERLRKHGRNDSAVTLRREAARYAPTQARRRVALDNACSSESEGASEPATHLKTHATRLAAPARINSTLDRTQTERRRTSRRCSSCGTG